MARDHDQFDTKKHTRDPDGQVSRTVNNCRSGNYSLSYQSIALLLCRYVAADTLSAYSTPHFYYASLSRLFPA